MGDGIKHELTRSWRTDMVSFAEIQALFQKAILNGASESPSAKVWISAGEGQRADSYCSIKIMWEDPE